MDRCVLQKAKMLIKSSQSSLTSTSRQDEPHPVLSDGSLYLASE